METKNSKLFKEVRGKDRKAMRLRLMALSTVELADFLQYLAIEKSALKGKIADNRGNRNRSNALKSVISCASAELESRQMRMELF